MPVVARNRAQKFHCLQLSPGLGAILQAMGIGFGNGVIHQGKTGASADKNFLRLGAQKLGKQDLCRGDTGQGSVIADVQLAVIKIFRLTENGCKTADHIQLLAAGFSAGHVELQAFLLCCFK